MLKLISLIEINYCSLGYIDIIGLGEDCLETSEKVEKIT
jgi:hypothetical protein